MTWTNKQTLNICNHLKAAIVIVAIGCTLISCSKDDDPDTQNASLNIISGNNQAGVYGEFLDDTIVLKVTAVDPKKFRIKFEMVQGNGILDYNGFYNYLFFEPDNQGILKVKWRLGCNSIPQKIKFLIYPAEAIDWQGQVVAGEMPLSTIVINATGKEPVGWGRACGCEVKDQFRFKIITHDHMRLYLVNQGLFYSDDKGINWYRVDGVPHADEVVDAAFNNKGWLYIVTRTKGLYFSQNLTSWESINNGILDFRDPTALTIEDSMLFVSFYFDGPYKSDNNGAFWRKMVVGAGSQRYHFITRHPNGDLYLFNDWHNLMLSKNSGETWQHVPVNYQYIRYAVYDFKIDKNGTLYIGAGDASISILSPVTYEGNVFSYYEWNANHQIVNNIVFFNDDVFYLVNYNPKPGVYSRSNNWNLVDLGFSKKPHYFFIKSPGNFLLAADGGLYYKN